MRNLVALQMPEETTPEEKPPRAYGSRLVVLPIPDAKKSAGGIWIDTHNIELNKVQRGRVVSVGPDVESQVQVGDVVLYARRFGWEYGPYLVLEDLPKVTNGNPTGESHIMAVEES